MAITVGDAQFLFLANTTELDRAYQQLELFPGVAEPVNAELKEVAGNWSFMGNTASTAAAETTVAAEEVVEAGHRMAGSYREAAGEARLLGEATGIHLPRHVTAFLAEIPGVQGALSAAFSATAVLFLIDALVKGTEKLSNWIGATFIFTQAMKDSDAATIVMNKSLLEQADLLKKSNDKIIELAATTTPVTLLQTKIDELSKSIKVNNDAFNEAHNIIGYYNLGLGGTEEKTSAAKDQITLLTKTIEAQNAALTVLQIEQQKAEADIALKNSLSRINNEKTTGAAVLALQKSQALEFIAGRSIEGEQTVIIEQHFEDQKFRLEMSSLEARLKAQKQFGSENVHEISQLNAQIEALGKDHDAKVIDQYRTTNKELEKANADLRASIEVTAATAEVTFVPAFKKMQDAAAALGIVTHGQLSSALAGVTTEYNKMKSSGLASLAEILQGQMRVTQATLEYRRAIGDVSGVRAAEKELQNLGAQYDQLTGHAEKSITHINTLMKLFDKDIRDAGNQTKFFADIGKDSLATFSSAAGNAFESFLKGQQGFGAAMKQATADVLDSLAAQAFANALYYTAMGIADLYWNPARSSTDFAAAGEFAIIAALFGAGGAALGSGAGGGGGNGGGSNSPNSATGGVVSQPGQNPTQSTNVQKFATGGLVTGPTLALMGEKHPQSREAAIPLDDPSAVRDIVKALSVAYAGKGSGDTINIGGVVSPDNMKKVMRQMGKQVRGNQGEMVATTSSRVVRRGL